MEGVAQYAKIIKGFEPSVSFQGESSPIRLMGIDTKEFASVAWMREDLNQTHLNEYLNLLGSEPMACLVSKTLCDQLKLKKGDAIVLKPTTSNPKTITLFLYEVVEYWPTYNEFTDPPLLIANGDYLDYMLPNLDYDAWLNLTPGTNTIAIEKEITRYYTLTDLSVRADQLEAVNYEASRQATNGILTLDFLAVSGVCLCCFLLFWVLSMKNRLFQLATLQAMGMTGRETSLMLLLEQLLISFVPILSAVCLAYVASQLFVPVISVAFSASMQVPPLRIAYRNADYYKVYAFVLMMLGLTFGVILPIIPKLKPAQAIKLSEE